MSARIKIFKIQSRHTFTPLVHLRIHIDIRFLFISFRRSSDGEEKVDDIFFDIFFMFHIFLAKDKARRLVVGESNIDGT